MSDRLFDDEDTTPWLPPLESETEAFDDDVPTIPDPRCAERMAELIESEKDEAVADLFTYKRRRN